MQPIPYNKRYILSRRALVFWALFIGVGAVGGAILMFVDPYGTATGMSGFLPYFRVLPFADKLFGNLIFSGIALLFVNGVPNLTAAALLFGHKKAGEILGGVSGITLMLWITVQFVIFPLNFMSATYFVFGFAQAVTGVLTLIGRAQSEFSAALQAEIAPQPETPVRNDQSVLVVYFSRRGYVKSLARKIAAAHNAALFELTTPERTAGNAGFWQSGRYGMLRRPMPIEKMPERLENYEEVYVCFPVWVFSVCAPVRDFLMKANGKIRNVRYVAVHFMNAKFENLAAEADKLVGVKHASFTSVRCRFGKFRPDFSAAERKRQP